MPTIHAMPVKEPPSSSKINPIKIIFSKRSRAIENSLKSSEILITTKFVGCKNPLIVDFEMLSKLSSGTKYGIKTINVSERNNKSENVNKFLFYKMFPIKGSKVEIQLKNGNSITYLFNKNKELLEMVKTDLKTQDQLHIIMGNDGKTVKSWKIADSDGKTKINVHLLKDEIKIFEKNNSENSLAEISYNIKTGNAREDILNPTTQNILKTNKKQYIPDNAGEYGGSVNLFGFNSKTYEHYFDDIPSRLLSIEW